MLSLDLNTRQYQARKLQNKWEKINLLSTMKDLRIILQECIEWQEHITPKQGIWATIQIQHCFPKFL